MPHVEHRAGLQLCLHGLLVLNPKAAHSPVHLRATRTLNSWYPTKTCLQQTALSTQSTRRGVCAFSVLGLDLPPTHRNVSKTENCTTPTTIPSWQGREKSDTGVTLLQMSTESWLPTVCDMFLSICLKV